MAGSKGRLHSRDYSKQKKPLPPACFQQMCPVTQTVLPLRWCPGSFHQEEPQNLIGPVDCVWAQRVSRRERGAGSGPGAALRSHPINYQTPSDRSSQLIDTLARANPAQAVPSCSVVGNSPPPGEGSAEVPVERAGSLTSKPGPLSTALGASILY